MELREAEALGVLDHHDGRGRHVDADLDHRGRDQELASAPSAKRAMARVLLGALHPAVHQLDLAAEALLQLGEALLGGGEIAGLGFLDQRADPVDALALVERAADCRRPPRRAARAARVRVSIGWRPAGFSRSSETSRSPK